MSNQALRLKISYSSSSPQRLGEIPSIVYLHESSISRIAWSKRSDDVPNVVVEFECSSVVSERGFVNERRIRVLESELTLEHGQHDLLELPIAARLHHEVHEKLPRAAGLSGVVNLYFVAVNSGSVIDPHRPMDKTRTSTRPHLYRRLHLPQCRNGRWQTRMGATSSENAGR
jgi:hypothetical protein